MEIHDISLAESSEPSEEDKIEYAYLDGYQFALDTVESIIKRTGSTLEVLLFIKMYRDMQ